MNAEHAEDILTPLWLGFEAACSRVEDLLKQAREASTEERIALGGLRHEADLEAALEYIRARAGAYIGDGLMTAVDTGRRVFCWPNVFPSGEARSLAIARWRETRESRRKNTKNVQPLRREA